MIATTIWGSPTTESASRIARIPIIGIKKSEGDRLKAALTASPKVRLKTKVTQGWATAPVVIADVPGKSPDFVMVATHLDACASADAAAQLASGQDVVLNTLQEKMSSTSGVNIDEEMAHLLSLQNAYSANARVMSTVNEMYKTLMQAI